MKRLYCVWRIDVDFSITDLDPSMKDQKLDDIIIAAIKADAENMAFMDETDKAEHIQMSITAATDSDDPSFMGYDMPALFVADSSTIHFLGV